MSETSSGDDPHRYSPKPPVSSPVRAGMYAAGGVHVVAISTALSLFALYGYELMRAVVVFTILGGIAAVWFGVARGMDQHERTQHLFPTKAATPKIFTDFKDDTGRNL